MSLNLIETIKEQLGTELVSKLAGQLGESETGITKVIGGLLPMVIGGLAENASNTSVLDIIKNPESKNILGDLLKSNGNSFVSGIIENIFGEKLGGIISGISAFSGVENSKVKSLLGVVTGASVGSISKVVSENNFSVSEITNLIESQKSEVSGLLPQGLSLSALGLAGGFASLSGIAGKVGEAVGNVTGKVGDLAGGVAGVAGSVAGATTEAVGDVAGKVGNVAGGVADATAKGGSSLLKWGLPLLLLLGAGLFLSKQCGNDKGADATTTVVDDTNQNEEALENNEDSTEILANTGERVLEELDLNGTKLKVYANGLESQIINFLKDGNYEKLSDDELKEKWFDFDNITFVFGKTDEITEESKVQLQNLTTILKAYPNAKVKIGAYTDKVGSEEGNLQTSQKRADFIKAELTKLGVGEQVEEAEGYGEKFAQVDENASDEERKADRKISIRFVK